MPENRQVRFDITAENRTKRDALAAEGALRAFLRAESPDLEDLLVAQMQLAGVPLERRPIYSVKTAEFTGGELAWPGGTLGAGAARLVDETRMSCTLQEATPFFLDFPLPSVIPSTASLAQQDGVHRFERVFALIVFGPRVAFVERSASGRYVVRPIVRGEGS